MSETTKSFIRWSNVIRPLLTLILKFFFWLQKNYRASKSILLSRCINLCGGKKSRQQFKASKMHAARISVDQCACANIYRVWTQLSTAFFAISFTVCLLVFILSTVEPMQFDKTTTFDRQLSPSNRSNNNNIKTTAKNGFKMNYFHKIFPCFKNCSGCAFAERKAKK